MWYSSRRRSGVWARTARMMRGVMPARAVLTEPMISRPGRAGGGLVHPALGPFRLQDDQGRGSARAWPAGVSRTIRLVRLNSWSTDVALQQPDLLAEGRLADVELGGGPAEVQVLPHGEKRPQLAQLETP